MTKEQRTDKSLDLIANLAKRIARIEGELADARHNAELLRKANERIAEDFDRYRERTNSEIDTLHRNQKRMAEEMANSVDSINGDIMMLDDRTQPLVALEKFYGGGDCG